MVSTRRSECASGPRYPFAYQFAFPQRSAVSFPCGAHAPRPVGRRCSFSLLRTGAVRSRASSATGSGPAGLATPVSNSPQATEERDGKRRDFFFPGRYCPPVSWPARAVPRKPLAGRWLSRSCSTLTGLIIISILRTHVCVRVADGTSSAALTSVPASFVCLLDQAFSFRNGAFHALCSAHLLFPEHCPPCRRALPEH